MQGGPGVLQDACAGIGTVRKGHAHSHRDGRRFTISPAKKPVDMIDLPGHLFLHAAVHPRHDNGKPGIADPADMIHGTERAAQDVSHMPDHQFGSNLSLLR